eukprot:1371008-Prymnesium_polylepis.1
MAASADIDFVVPITDDDPPTVVASRLHSLAAQSSLHAINKLGQPLDESRLHVRNAREAFGHISPHSKALHGGLWRRGIDLEEEIAKRLGIAPARRLKSIGRLVELSPYAAYNTVETTQEHFRAPKLARAGLASGRHQGHFHGRHAMLVRMALHKCCEIEHRDVLSPSALRLVRDLQNPRLLKVHGMVRARTALLDARPLLMGTAPGFSKVLTELLEDRATTLLT